jgi:hypothetical protein
MAHFEIKKINIIIMRTFKLFLLIGVLLCSCTQQRQSKKTNAGATQKTESVMKKSGIAIPSWLIGTWEGDFNDAQYNMNIHFTVVVQSNGTVTQTSSVKGEENEVLQGQCTEVAEDYIAINFQGESESTTYYIDKESKQLGISENNWLKKK